MMLVAYRPGPDMPWNVWPHARSYAEARAAQVALMAGGFRCHVFDRESIAHLQATHHGFAQVKKTEQVPVSLRRRSSDGISLFGEGRF